MKKLSSLCLLTLVLCSAASAQSVRDNIDKAIKHPAREINEAKADQLQTDKKKIMDSTTMAAGANKKAGRKLKKKKRSS